jgi:U3 small nucleolar RNA-associated protein 12
VEGLEINISYLKNRGVLHRQVKDRALEVKFHPIQDYFAIHGSEKGVELWRIRSEEEVKKALARKRKRVREKQAALDVKAVVSI